MLILIAAAFGCIMAWLIHGTNKQFKEAKKGLDKIEEKIDALEKEIDRLIKN